MPLVIRVILVVLALSLPPRAAGSACHISGCSLPSSSNCSLNHNIHGENYIPVNNLSHTSPPMDDPGHLFNLLQDPLEEDCVFLGLHNSNISGEFIFSLAVSCRSQIGISSRITFQVNSNSEAANSCLEKVRKSVESLRMCS